MTPFTVEALAAAVSSPTPERFYLPRATLAGADAALAVEGGCRLPVHSQLLALASPVLEAAFAGQADGACPEGTFKADRSTQVQAPAGAPTVLATPFCAYSLQAVLAFLRLEVYIHPEDACDSCTSAASGLPAVPHLLPQLLDLSHCLQAERLFGRLVVHASRPEVLRGPAGAGHLLPQLMETAHRVHADAVLTAVVQHVQQAEPAAGEQIMDWIRVADSCQLGSARQLGVAKLAARLLASGSLPASSAQWVVEHVQGGLLPELLTALVERKASTITWRIPPKNSADRSVKSPLFRAVGAEWQLSIYDTGCVPQLRIDHVSGPKEAVAFAIKLFGGRLKEEHVASAGGGRHVTAWMDDDAWRAGNAWVEVKVASLA